MKARTIPKLVWIGAGIIGAGILPIALYSVFGPKDGNPVGLGILMMVCEPIGGLVLLIGAIGLKVKK